MPSNATSGNSYHVIRRDDYGDLKGIVVPVAATRH